MVQTLTIKATKRDGSGSGAARRLRKGGFLPAVLNNEKGEARAIQLNRHEFGLILGHQRSERLLFDLQIEGEPVQKALLKEVQHDTVTDELLHADFLAVSMTRKMRVSVPVVLVGTSVGVAQEEGIMDQLLREVEIECLPADLPESLTVDVSGLHMNQAAQVGAIQVDPAKITILTDKAIAVAHVSAPHEEEEVAPEEAAAAGTTEPEVISKGKEDEEEEGAEGAEKAAGKEGAKEKAPAAEKGKPAEKGKAPAGDKGKAPAADKGKPAADKGKAPAGDKGKAPAGKK